MQRLILILLPLLLATSASAADGAWSLDEWSYDRLRGDARLSELLRHDVESVTDRQMGQMRDVIIDSDGELAAAVIEFEEGIGNTGVAIGIFEWSDAVVEPAQETVTVSIGINDEPRQAFDVDGLPASEIVGRRVVLADDPAFGEVVDLFVDLEEELATALLVQAQGTYYALPLRRLEGEVEFVRYPFSTEEVVALGEYGVNSAQPSGE